MKKLVITGISMFGLLVVFALAGVPLVADAATSTGTCLKSACEAENTLTTDQTCVCGTATATASLKWCNAARNSAYDTQSACNAAGTTPAPGTPGSGLNIDFVKPGLRGIQTQGNLDTIEQLATFVTKIGNYLFTFLMAAAVILIIWGAFDFIAGGGDPKRIETARQKIMWAFVGIAIALLAVFFAPIVKSFLNVKTEGGL